jgi:hypothetical protein
MTPVPGVVLVIYVHIVADILATYLDFYVACNTNAKICNIQACTDSFEPPVRLSGLEEEWVGSLTSFGCCTGGGNVGIIRV